MQKKEEVQTEESLRYSLPHLYLAAIGFAVSLYALRVHNSLEAGGGSGCGFTESINCDKVLISSWGKILGIPLGVYGMAFFVVVVLLSIYTSPIARPRREAGGRLLISTLGLAGSIFLSYISFVLIKAACPICLGVHATIIALFGFSLFQYLRVKKESVN